MIDAAERAPVWRALSELYLDTELTDSMLRAIARTLAASPYSCEELRDIDRWEVAPIVGGNLTLVAGVWAGFDDAWIERECAARARDAERRRLRERGGLLGRLRTRWLRRMTGDAWARLEPMVAGLRAGER